MYCFIRLCICRIISYFRNPAGAQPYFVLSFYDELAADKGLVLVRGDVMPVALSEAEGKKLLALVREFYLEKPEEIKAFNKGTFDFEKHISSVLERPA